MDKIARIRQEIERRMKIYKESNYGISLRYQELEELLSFLDTLSEEPDKGLEEAAKEYSKRVSDGHNFRDLTCGFIAGAEWQASQMPMPEDTVLFQKGVAEGKRLEREDMTIDAEECELYWDGDFLAIDLNMAALGYSEKDKVKVIVLKNNEDESK